MLARETYRQATRRPDVDEPAWVFAAELADLAIDDISEVQVGGRTIAIYNTAGRYYATDGICTHENERLADGLMLGNIVECPRHQGRFDFRTGAPKGAPASVPLCTFPVRTVGQHLEIQIIK